MKKFLQLILVVVCACLYGNAQNSPITVYAKCGDESFEPKWVHAWGANGDLWEWMKSKELSTVQLEGVTYYYYKFDAQNTNGTTYVVGSEINVIFKNYIDNKDVQTVDLTGIAESCVYEINGKEGDKYKATKVDTPTLKAPTISYDGKVTITRDFADAAKVYYRIGEGDTQEYNAPFAVENGATVTTWAEYDIFKSAEVTETIKFTVSNPVIEFEGQKDENTGVTKYYFKISCEKTEGATIYYATASIEDFELTEQNRDEYVNPIEITEDFLYIKAIAVKDGWNDSKVMSKNFNKAEGIVEPIKIYVKKAAPFEVKKIYAWYGEGEEKQEPCGNWPGADLTETTEVDGSEYYFYKFEKEVRCVNIIFNGGNSPQTVNIESISGSHTFVISSEKDGDKYKVNDDTTVTGVESVSEDDANAPVEYFNLQGVRVENPQNGLYIVRQGNKVSKQIIR